MKGQTLGTELPATFQTDLKEAHECENKLKKLFEQNYNCTVITSQELGSFPDWDLSVELHDTNYSFTVEVKQDKQTAVTKNIAVEYQRTLKDGTVRPTCISTSQATIWAYHISNTFYLIDTVTLRQIIKDKLYFKAVDNAGDGNRASIYLFKKDVFLKYAENINKIIKENIK